MSGCILDTEVGLDPNSQSGREHSKKGQEPLTYIAMGTQKLTGLKAPKFTRIVWRYYFFTASFGLRTILEFLVKYLSPFNCGVVFGEIVIIVIRV